MIDRVHFTVWQFVRLCVGLEKAAAAGKAEARALLDAWGEIWSEVDAALTRLAAEDFPAYAEMMMDRDVVIEDVTARQAAACVETLTAVIAEMDEDLAGEKEKDVRENLTFERRELARLKAHLAGLEG